jgi:benzoate 4-monooxygenase
LAISDRYRNIPDEISAADYSFGAPFGFLDTGHDDLDLIRTIDARGEVFNALGHLPLAIRPFMRHFYLDSFWYAGLRASSNLAKIGVAAYKKRAAQEKSDDSNPSTRKDLMSFLIKAKDPDTGLPLPGDEIAAEAISFIVGGSDTTSSTMTNFVDFVSRDMEVQSKMYRELREAFPGPLDKDWVASYDVASKLPFLNAVLKEVMRVRPTSSTGLERVTPRGGATVAGVFLPEGVSAAYMPPSSQTGGAWSRMHSC